MSSLLICSPSEGAVSAGLAKASTGIGAEFLFRGTFVAVVAIGGVSGGVSSSSTGVISPVHPTSVWFHGV